jgi:hypothetical protein
MTMFLARPPRWVVFSLGVVTIFIPQIRYSGLEYLIMKGTLTLAALSMAVVALGADRKDTMCVKQKDGTYKCKARGKIEKEPCCDTPSNAPKPTPKPKK